MGGAVVCEGGAVVCVGGAVVCVGEPTARQNPRN